MVNNMYSHEIEELLRLRNYLLTVKEYFYICDTSPQINRIKYESSSYDYEIWTIDNYYCKFKFKKKEK